MGSFTLGALTLAIERLSDLLVGLLHHHLALLLHALLHLLACDSFLLGLHPGHLLWIRHRQVGAHEDACRIVVDLVDHVLEEVRRLDLEDHQRVFLLVAHILHRVLQFVELSEVLLPRLVDEVQEHDLLESEHDGLALCFVGLFERQGYLIDSASVGDRHTDVLVHLSMLLIDLLDDRPCRLSQLVGLGLEGGNHGIVSPVFQAFAAFALKLLGSERRLHGHNGEELLADALVFAIVLDDVDTAVPEDVGDVHADAFTHQGMTAALIDDAALVVHHVVVLQQALTDTEVVLLHFLLGAFDRLVDHRVLDDLVFLESHAVHEFHDSFAGEQTHEFVFERDEEDG